MTTFLAWIVLAVPSYASGPVPPTGTAIPDSTPNDDLPAVEPKAGDVVEEAEDQVPEEGADEVAVEQSPKGGIWEWVDKLEGEVPTEDQVAAMEESKLEQQALVDLVREISAPVAMYDDPAKVLYVDPLFLDQVDPSEFDIPVEVNGEVAKWVTYFTGPGRKHYARWMKRSTRYRPMMYEKLEARGLPKDLVYLSMIESGYNAHAYSHAHAAGLWQFIPSTARLYKMRVDYWVDDRRDPAMSTEAAMDFLEELHTMFGDWRLAWAGYNTGPGRVRRATRNAGTKDFWKISAGPYLASETDNYVPKIMAAAIIGHHPERYGFTGIDFEDELAYDEVRVGHSVEVKLLAKAAGISEDDFRYLNPALRRYATPPEGYTLRVPAGKQKTFASALTKLPKVKPVTYVKHTVKRGESLSKIAARYGVGVSTVSKANRLKNKNRIYVGQKLTIPKGKGAPAVASKGSSTKKKVKTSTHVVRRGDTLSTIAGRYGTSTSNLRGLNKISGSRIYVGQKLKVNGTAKSTASVSRTALHTVKSGETLSGIATRYGTTTSALQKLNGIRHAGSIRSGQRLKVPSKGKAASSWTTYTVRGGDSLGRIASARGCTVSQLKSWNSLKSSTIHPGQKLKVKK